MLPCVNLPKGSNGKIGVWTERHKNFLKEHHRIRYYNLLIAGKLNTPCGHRATSGNNVYKSC